MADQTIHDLKYGHLGHVLYNSTDGTWLSRRHFSSFQSIHPLSPSQWVVRPADAAAAAASASASASSSEPSQTPSSVEKRGPSRLARLQFPHLAQRIQTAAPSADLSVSLASESQNVVTVTTRHDPTSGELLAFGRVMDKSTRRAIHIAVFPDRTSPTLLSLMQVQYQKQGWDRNKSVWIDVPRLGGESGTWDALQPVRQICFSTPSEDPHALTSCMAVRTTVAIHILRPSLRTSMASWDSINNTPSRFRVAPIYNIDLDVLGGIPPADVSFNPFYDKQFATIDQQGTWRIWDMSYHSTGHQGLPLQIAAGAAGDEFVADASAELRVLDDGWGRITWAANSSTILAASRRAIGIYDVGTKPMRLATPNLGISGTPYWILDVQQSPSPNPVIFVLTSINLICMRIVPFSEPDPNGLDAAGGHIIFQTRHFRDPEDISLRLSTFSDAEDVFILLKSSLSLVATIYRCSFAETSTTPFLSISDPTLVNLPEDSSSDGTTLGSLGLRVHPVEYGENNRGASGSGQEYRDSNVRFYMMTMLSSNMGLLEKLYFGRNGTSVDMSPVHPTSWHSKMTFGAPRLQNNRFVVNDDYMIDGSERGEVKQTMPTAQAFVEKSSSSQPGKRTWTLTYEKSYQDINRAKQDGAQDFSDALEAIKVDLEDTGKPQMGGVAILSDVCQPKISIGDLDEATAQFQSLLADYKGSAGSQGAEEVAQLKPASLAEARVIGLPTEMAMVPNVMTVYDDIVSHWLTPLSPRIPGRVRLAKEQLARRVAAEVCLASCKLRWPDTGPTPEEADNFAEVSQAHEMNFFRSSQPQSSLPTPPPTATPSMTTAASLSSHPSTLASPEYLRLQQYTTFISEKPTPAPLPKALAKKLAHWRVGDSPAEYDWLATQKQQDKEAEEEDEGLTLKQRARLKRRAEKHLKEQRRERLKSDLTRLASSQAPQILSTSQAAPVVGLGAASQGVALASSQPTQGASTQLPATQILAGRHGGRVQPAKKKKKARQDGF